jgi:serine/threonine-protein kinase
MDETPFAARTDLAPAAYLSQVGTIFAVFDARTQDSGNISYGIEAGGQRWFVKTAGDPADPAPFLPHPERVALLENAQRVAQALRHPALPLLHGVTQSPWGPMLAYAWAPGELLRVPAERRQDPESSHQRS